MASNKKRLSRIKGFFSTGLRYLKRDISNSLKSLTDFYTSFDKANRDLEKLSEDPELKEEVLRLSSYLDEVKIVISQLKQDFENSDGRLKKILI